MSKLAGWQNDDLQAPRRVLASCENDAFGGAAPTVAAEASNLLSDIVRRARLRCVAVEMLQFTAPWGFSVRAETATFYYVLQGGCRLTAGEVDTTILLSAGQLALVMPGCDHCLRDSASSVVVPLEGIVAIHAVQEGAALGGAERSTRLIYGSIILDERRAFPLLGSLSSVVVVRDGNERAAAWLDQTLKYMIHESRDCRPGSQSVVDLLTQVVFIHAIRGSANVASCGYGAWLAALRDPEIGLALKIMHTCLDSPWTVAALARHVRLSRSVFALRFKTLLSTSPMQYLMERRMERACEMLSGDKYATKQVAARVGYASKAAFSSAFKRRYGQSPQEYRRCPKTPPRTKQPEANAPGSPRRNSGVSLRQKATTREIPER
jgi:AraC-like DNA-binding protein